MSSYKNLGETDRQQNQTIARKNMKHFRRVLFTTKQDGIRNIDIRRELQIKLVNIFIEKKTIRHLQEKNNYRQLYKGRLN